MYTIKFSGHNNNNNGRWSAFKARTHAIAGFWLWLLLWTIGVPVQLLPILIGALFPDADKRSTVIGGIVPLWIMFKHRRTTHTFGMMFIVSGIVYLIFGTLTAVSFGIGYTLHLLMDMVTPASLPLFRKKKRG